VESKQSQQRVAMARALGRAIEPLADLCLQAGFTSPEMESLVRSVFVHQAVALLEKTPRKKNSKRPASDVRVGLVTGLHRNDVRKIRATKPRVEPKRTERRNRAGQILKAWFEDPRFLGDHGQPRDLPINASAEEPSFEELVRNFLPNVSVGSALGELRRSGAVQLLPDEIVRVRSRSPRTAGLTAASVASATDKMAALAYTVFHNVLHRDEQFINEESEVVRIPRSRLPLVRAILERRIAAFLEAIEKELSVEPKGSEDSIQMRIMVFAHEK